MKVASVYASQDQEGVAAYTPDISKVALGMKIRQLGSCNYIIL